MNKRFHAVPWMVGISAGLMLALLIPPVTRIIMCGQFQVAILHNNDIFKLGSKLPQIASSYPNDIEVQVGALCLPQTWNNRYGIKENENAAIRKISRIVARFPNKPVVYAVALKQLILSGMYLNRVKDQTIPPDNNTGSVKSHVDMRLTKLFDSYCMAGERLDPRNAYFYYMRSISLFVMHRDSEALRQIEIASQKPEYNDYFSLEDQYLLHTVDRITGGENVLVRFYTYAGVIFPEYANCRASAQIAIHKACLLEQKGDLQAGFVIRKAVRKYGTLMSEDSTVSIGNLVGMALTGISMDDFPGYPPNTNPYNPTIFYTRVKAYADYLKKIHHPNEALDYMQQYQLSNSIRTVMRKNNNIFDMITKDCYVWLAGMIVLMNAYWIIIATFASLIINKLTCIKFTKSIPDSIKLCTVIIPFLLIFFEYSVLYSMRQNSIMIILTALLMLFVLLTWFKKDTLKNWNLFDVPHLFLWFLTILLGVFIILWPNVLVNQKNTFLLELLIITSLLIMLLNKISEYFGGWTRRLTISVLIIALIALTISLFEIASSWQIMGLTNSFYDFVSSNNQRIYLYLNSLPVIIPQIVVIASVIVSFLHHEPYFQGFVRHMRNIAVPLVCIILIGWSGVILFTVKNEAKINTLQNMIISTGEIQTLARISHISLPRVER